MPFVQIRMAHDPANPLTTENKKQVIQEITNTLAKTLNRNPNNVLVEIFESQPDNWGLGGQTVAERRAAANKAGQ